MKLLHPLPADQVGSLPARHRHRVWSARALVVAMIATAMVVAPSLGSGADAAPASSGAIELGDLPVVDRARAEVAVDDHAHGAHEPQGGPEEDHAEEDHAEEDHAEEDHADETEVVDFVELEPVDAEHVVMVGLGTDDGAEPAAAVRTQTDGEWIEWTPLLYSHGHEGPDPNSEEGREAANTTEPLWIGEVDRVQVRVEEGTQALDGLRLHTVEIHGSTEFDPLAPTAGAAEASASAPDIIPRSKWDPNNDCKPRKAASYADGAELGVVHHTASSNSYTEAQAASQVRSICLYHRNSRGWNDIGYNFLVDRYGKAYEGRAGGTERAVIGAHASGYNTGSIGIAGLGTFDGSVPSATVGAIERVLTWKFAIHGIDPTGRSATYGVRTLVGHRDLGQTSCPGSHLYTYHVSSMGERIADAVAALRAELRNWSDGQVGDFGGKGQGIATYSGGTGETWMADPNSGSFGYSPWSTFRTRDGWDDPLVADFTGDGLDDVAYFHSGSGNWWVNRSDGKKFSSEHWSTFKTTRGWDTHITGDFDGDGRQDIASYHRNGSWWVSTSDGQGFEVSQWGAYRTTDGWQTHMAGNFTGDGRDEILSYHPGSGRWYLLEAQTTGLLFRETSFEYRQYGRFRTSTGWSHQLAGDFDGDGRTDVANYHPRNGTWWIGTSGPRSLTFTQWAQFTTRRGWQTHLIGDVTGEGRDDIVSYHPRSGNFWVSESTGEDFAGDRWMQFGLNTGWGRHVLLDVDDDGRKDVASYHLEYDDWWVMRSNGSSPFATPRKNQW